MFDFEKEYTKYMLSWDYKPSCVKFWSLVWKSNLSINRKLWSKKYTPKMLFNELTKYINLEGGTISVDDTVIDKKYSRETKWELLWKFWSWKHKKVVLWINLITLFFTDNKWTKIPLTWRVVDKKEWTTKNEYFRDMLSEALNWWIKPSIVTFDSWYSSWENLNYINSLWIDFLCSIKKNRLLSKDIRKYKKIQEYPISEEWEVLHLKNVWFVKVFKKNGRTYIFKSWSDKSKRKKDWTKKFSTASFHKEHNTHWGIECFHRAIKQLCCIEKWLFRNKCQIKNHIY